VTEAFDTTDMEPAKAETRFGSRGYSGATRLALALGLALLLVATLAWSVRASPNHATRPENVSPGVWEATADGAEADFFLLLAVQADLSGASGQPNREARLEYVYDRLREVALRSQAPLRTELDASGSPYRSFYIANMLLVRGDRVLVERVAARPDVARIASNPRVRQALPPSEETAAVPSSETSIEWDQRRPGLGAGLYGHEHHRGRAGYRLRLGPPRADPSVPGIQRRHRDA